MKSKGERIRTVLGFREQGLTLKHSCQAAGVGVSTYEAWRAADPELQERDECAHATWVATAHTRVDVDDPKWLLERLSTDYNRKVEVEQRVTLDMPSLLPPGALTVDWDALQAKADAGTLEPEHVRDALPVLADGVPEADGDA